MAGAFNEVNLSQMSPPDAVELLDFETICADILADFLARDPSHTAPLESDPAFKVLETSAYRELLLRQRVNDSVRAVMPASALGADLENIAALFGVSRRVIMPADLITGANAVMEDDEVFRRRMVLAPEGYSVAGPVGAYVFHALTSDPDVLDVGVTSPAPGEVLVSVLSRVGNGTASAGLIATVSEYLTDDTRRPLTDFVTVQSAAILNYAIAATITTYAGPDAAVVLAAARARLDVYVAESRRMGRDITRSGITAALHVDGVHKVAITSPAADIVAGDHDAAFCTGITLTHAGVGE